MSEHNGIPHVTRLTWCMTTNGYADEATCHDGESGATKVDHDHYDVATDTETGKVLWRIDPVGTTYLLSDGSTLRLTAHDNDVFAAEPMEDHLIPRYDYWSPNGGASTTSPGTVWEVWHGGALRSSVMRTVLASEGRPAPGSLFLRPNGEAWRLSDYGTDYHAKPFTGDKTKPTYVVMYPSRGTMGSGGHVLPDDARLVWAP